VGHARVSLNGLELGLYVLKEGFTADFIARSFGNAAGGLYEAGLANDIDQPMELDSGEPDPDALRALASATREPAGERIQHLARVLEFEAFVRFMAIESLLCHWDGYSFSANNFRIYVTEHGKIHFLPSGMDQVFAKADLPWDMPMGGLVARAVMGTEPGRTEYGKTLRGLVQEFDPRRWIDEIEHWRAQLRPHLTAAEYQSIEEKSSALAQQLHSRKRHLLVQLENAERRSLRFVNDIAAISGWRAFNSPEDGMLTQDESGLRIVAGAKTSASWRATVRLKPGHYIMRADATTQGLIPLPFGRRNGATLRVVGTDARSHSELASGTTPLDCTFEVIEEQDVTLACELRASAGMVLFAKPILLQVAQKK
jgi:hypothetical protein